MKTINKKTIIRLFAALFTLLLFAAYFSFVSFDIGNAEDSNEIFYTSKIAVANGQFANAGSDYPSEPESWTGAYMGNFGNSGVTNGVIDLGNLSEKDSDIKNKYKLRGYYDEFRNQDPKSAYGTNGFSDDDNTKVLLINALDSNVAFGYTSSSISLSKNSYYKISVWAKTSDNAKASIKLESSNEDSSFKNDISFDQINTVDYHNSFSGKNITNNGWVNYSFYVETSTLADASVVLRLQLGNVTTWVDDDGNTQSYSYDSCGYAMFDNVSVYQYSPILFEEEIENFNKENGASNEIRSNTARHFYTNIEGNKMFFSECDAVSLSIKDDKVLGLDNETAEISPEFKANVIGDFDQLENTWIASEDSKNGEYKFGTYNSTNTTLGIKENSEIPYSPNGQNDSIMIMSSYSGNAFKSAAYGYQTPEFTLNRHKHYKISVWVKTIGGDTANVVVSGEDYRGKNTITGKNQLYFSSGLKGSGDRIPARNNWSEVSFFVEGSSFTDYKIHVELWLGIGKAIDNGGNSITRHEVEGAAMFDNLRIEEISNNEFINFSGSGTTVTFDKIITESGFANRTFDKIADYKKFQYPFEPKDWSYHEVNENSSISMSKMTVTENISKGVMAQKDWDKHIIRGVIPTDDETFSANRQNFGALYSNPGTSGTVGIEHAKGSNALLLSSQTSVAVGYSSSIVTLPAQSSQRVDIKMYVQDMTGHGANLVLKRGSNIISTIERIGIDSAIDNRWMTYSFYLEGGVADHGDISVEIWLGLFDKDNNVSKLASGIIVVDEVNYAANTDTVNTFDKKHEEYASNTMSSTFAAYSFMRNNFYAFDRYDNTFLKYSYDYTVTSGSAISQLGVFNSKSIPVGTSELWEGYANDNAANTTYKMLLKNNVAGYSRAASTETHVISPKNYYKLTVRAKVNIPYNQESSHPQYQGAYIGISATGEDDHLISDIKTTAEVTNIYDPSSVNNECFRDFVFFIKGADTEEGSANATIVFGIGGSGENQGARGTIIIDSIVLQSSTDAEYSENKGIITATQSKESKTMMTISFAPDKEVADETKTPDESKLDASSNWFIVTGIAFAIVIIVAVIAVAVRYVARKRKLAEPVAAGEVSSYDRRVTLFKQHNKRAALGETIDVQIDAYDEFDEELEDEVRNDAYAAKLAEIEKEATEEISEDISETPADDAATVEAGETAVAEVAETDAASDEQALNADQDVKNEESADEGKGEFRYEEVIEFTARDYTPTKKVDESKEQASSATRKRTRYDDEQPKRYNDWDNFDD